MLTAAPGSPPHHAAPVAPRGALDGVIAVGATSGADALTGILSELVAWTGTSGMARAS
jgi:hypothetical protein